MDFHVEGGWAEIAWEVPGAFLVKIEGIKAFFWRRGQAVIPVNAHTNTIVITAVGVWGKQIEQLPVSVLKFQEKERELTLGQVHLRQGPFPGQDRKRDLELPRVEVSLPAISSLRGEGEVSLPGKRMRKSRLKPLKIKLKVPQYIEHSAPD